MSLPSSPYCVVTGAGSGFGRAIALALAGRKGRLLLSDVNLSSVEETAEMVRNAGGRASVQRCDVRQLGDVEALAAACEGPVDLLVNNAGVGSGGLVGELPMEDWRWTIDVDLFGVVHGCHVFTPIFRKQGRGHILNVASAAGLIASPRLAAYCVAKAGVVALSEALFVELNGTGVGVTVLCPTFFKSDIANAGRYADERTRQIAERQVTVRGIEVEKVVAAALASVDRGELYSLPMRDGRWLWRLKRTSPEWFTRFLPSLLRRLK